MRTQIFTEVENQIASLACEADEVMRHEKVKSLIECPQPLLRLFAPRLVTAEAEMRKLMLEVLTWRYYRIRNLSEFRSLSVQDHCFMTGEYDHEGKAHSYVHYVR